MKTRIQTFLDASPLLTNLNPGEGCEEEEEEALPPGVTNPSSAPTAHIPALPGLAGTRPPKLHFSSIDH